MKCSQATETRAIGVDSARRLDGSRPPQCETTRLQRRFATHLVSDRQGLASVQTIAQHHEGAFDAQVEEPAATMQLTA